MRLKLFLIALVSAVLQISAQTATVNGLVVSSASGNPVNGAQVSLRKAEGDNESDIKRTSRQQKMVSILLEKIRGLSLPELQNLANKVLPLITTSMDNAQITEYLLNYLPMLPELTLQSGGTCPAEYKGDRVDIYGDGVLHSVLRFDENATKKAMRAITEGEVE